MNANAALDRPAAADSLAQGLPLALLAHALLVAALAFGVSWRSSDDNGVAEAELWAAVPQAVAPPEQQAPPPPPPEPDRRAERREAERQEQLEREAEIAERREQEKKQKLKLQREEAERKERAAEEKKRREDEKRKAEKLEQQQAEKQAKADEARREKLRQDNLRRMQGLAGTSGNETSTGTAARSAGPSANYNGRIIARVRPNITLAEAISGNPKAEVEVKTAPDGLIIARRLVKPSGDAAWDAAVLRAVDKTERLPRDEDGRVPPVLILSFKPND